MKKLKLGECSKKVKHASCSLWAKLAHFLLFQLNPFWLELGYFITLSLFCFLTLKSSNTRRSSPPPPLLDLFFTSVSAVTVSSMSTLEMELFSSTQLLFLTFFMLAGGEVFTSLLQLHLTINKRKSLLTIDQQTQSIAIHQEEEEEAVYNSNKSLKILTYLITCYLVLLHALGSTLISIYLSLTPTAAKILKIKRINPQVFAIFTTVSTFANCGFVPTNENMIVFRNNSGLLLILIPLILMGNTLYPVFLRLAIWLSHKATNMPEFRYMLKTSGDFGYGAHLLSPSRCVYLAITALAFVVLQFVLFCALDWNSAAGTVYQKAVAVLFQVVNSRHAGESVFDLSVLSPAVLLLFVLMMYLPPYTSYLPIEKGENISTSGGGAKNTRKIKKIRDHIIFSQLTYLTIFVILVCITEKHKMRNDPLNFNVFNIIIEVISAYGNVGFTMGYSCERLIKHDGECKNEWSGFAGRWSSAGKFVLIVVMFFGRLKKFNNGGGRAWILP
ncbi:sodium transporter HKT1-like [Salvia miltiorrhiza]|uniref:sodium transporter HKT1-like n=1 Tax=Salvia miltiorrhiza TaxID=226208 RepID=UPI0025AD496C|nr:sodium transporter HKT1-like [Salvia miltiorrhiza]